MNTEGPISAPAGEPAETTVTEPAAAGQDVTAAPAPPEDAGQLTAEQLTEEIERTR